MRRSPLAPRRRRPVACLLVLAALLGLTSCDAALLNQVLNGYADNATASTMNGGDNGWSIDLGNGRHMVLINDPYLGPIDSAGNRAPGSIITQGFGIVIIDSDGSIDTLLGDGRTSLFAPPESNRKYWVTGGVIDGGAVHLLVQEVLGAYDLLGNSVITLSLSHLRAAVPSVQQVGPIVDIPQSNRAAWGEGIVSWQGHWYLYAPNRSGDVRTLLARVPVGSLRTPSAWEYWTGSAWSDYQDNAAPLVKADGSPVDRLLRPVVHGGRIVALAQDRTIYTDEYTWATSASPTAPVTMTGRAYRPPELDVTCAPGENLDVYSLHPHSTSPAEASIWSYSVHCPAPSRRARYYRPVFFEVDLRDAPCPVLSTDQADAFIRATHEDFYDRTPTATELSTLGTDLTVEGRCRSHYLAAMDDSSAYLDDIVDGLYQQLLERLPSSGDRAYWMGELRTGARTTARMARAIIDGAEFKSLAGGTAAGFVTRVYEQVLGWTPGAGDLDYWTGRLAAGDDHDVVGLAIYQSAESRGIRADDLGTRFLQRLPTAAERSSWVATMGTNGGDDIAVSRSIAASSTYLLIAQSRF